MARPAHRLDPPGRAWRRPAADGTADGKESAVTFDSGQMRPGRLQRVARLPFAPMRIEREHARAKGTRFVFASDHPESIPGGRSEVERSETGKSGSSCTVNGSGRRRPP
jgi:hypothetical protein